jgi:hypothetical protein
MTPLLIKHTLQRKFTTMEDPPLKFAPPIGPPNATDVRVAEMNCWSRVYAATLAAENSKHILVPVIDAVNNILNSIEQRSASEADNAVFSMRSRY